MSSLPSVNLNALFSASGSAASGIDVSAAVSQIMYADRATERQWQAQQQIIDLQTDALNQVNGLASSLIDKLNALQDPVGALTAMSTTSSQPSLVTGSATPGTAPGNHIVVVQNLATTASWYSIAVPDSSTPFAAGNFALIVGTGAAQTTTPIAIGNGVDTPEQLADYINGLKLNVTASVVNDAGGSRVALVSTSSGQANDFSIDPVPSDPPTVPAPPNLFTRAATGSNASLTVDGIPISSTTNAVSGVINGVTLNLSGQSSGTEVILSVAPDSGRASQGISDFVNAYNALIGRVNGEFVYDAANQTAGPLSSDSALRMLQSELLAAPSFSGNGSSINSLRSLGITMNNDGTLTVDSGALKTAIQNNTSGVQAFFQGTAANGFAVNLKNAVNTFADPSEGAFTVDLRSLSNQKADLQDQIDDYERYLATEQTRLTNQYNLANILLQQLPTQQKQIDAMLGDNSNGSNG